MKTPYKLLISILVCCSAFWACEDKDYAAGLPEYEHHYYVVYVPNNNSQVTVNRNQTDLLKLPVQFYSSFTRNYDAVAHYTLSTEGITDQAISGVDFEVVDHSGNTLQPENGKYKLIFPQAVQATDTIYIRLLNNPATGNRSVQINLEDHVTDTYRVDIFSTAFRRTLLIE